MTAVVQGGQWRCNRLFFFPFFLPERSLERTEVSHEPQASAGQGEKDQPGF